MHASTFHTEGPIRGSHAHKDDTEIICFAIMLWVVATRIGESYSKAFDRSKNWVIIRFENWMNVVIVIDSYF